MEGRKQQSLLPCHRLASPPVRAHPEGDGARLCSLRSPPLRLLALFFLLALLFALPFALFGSGEEAAAWLAQLRTAAWLVGPLLLASDLLLPVPASGVLAALGLFYGPLAGGALGTLGLLLAGLAGWMVGRLLGPSLATRLFAPAEWERGADLFARWGGLLVAGSRAVPLLPEVASVAAGMFGMPFWTFLAALLCGALPVAFAFAAFGAAFADRPLVALILSLLPGGLWFLLAGRLAAREPPTSGAAHQRLEEEGQGEARGAEEGRPTGRRQKATVEQADGGDQQRHGATDIARSAAGEEGERHAARRDEREPGDEPERMGEGEAETDDRGEGEEGERPCGLAAQRMLLPSDPAQADHVGEARERGEPERR